MDVQDRATLQPSPEERANPVSKLLFNWVQPLLRVGFARPLQLEDVWELPDADLTDRCSEAVARHYAGRTRLWRALNAALGRSFWTAGLILRPAYLAALIAQVFLLRAIVRAVEQPDSATVLEGVLLAVGLAAVTAVSSVFVNNLFFWGVRCGLRARGALTVMLFRKCTRLSLSSLIGVSAGGVMNLCTNDTFRVMEGGHYFHFLWSGGMEITAVVAMLLMEVGVAALAGVGVLLAMVPVQMWFARMVGRVQRAAVAHTDERTRMMNEILSSVLLIKLYAWEDSFMEQVERSRGDEVRMLRRSEILKAVNTAVFLAAPIAAAAATFATHTALGNDLTPATAFTVLAWMGVAMRSLIMVPRGAQATAEALVSLARVERFLQLPELAADAAERADAAHAVALPVIELRDSDFYWPEMAPIALQGLLPRSAPSKPAAAPAPAAPAHADAVHADDADTSARAALRGITLRVLPGEFHAVIGPVAAGKTSLLCALLGEMADAPAAAVGTGVRAVRGGVAYVPQQAWVLNDTLRANVLFGREMDARRYAAVLHACCMEEDIAEMPAGDLTEIGERGVSLSGGQKQRLSLARACYRDADVYLLDDVISALDAHIARRVFDRCLGAGGLLAGKTRLLVTHAVSFLPEVQVVHVMQDGAIVASGPFARLEAERSAEVQALLARVAEEGKELEAEAQATQAAAAAAAETAEEAEAEVAEEGAAADSVDESPTAAAPADAASAAAEVTVEAVEARLRAATRSRSRSCSASKAGEQRPGPAAQGDAKSARVTSAETRHTGGVGSATYLTYVRAGGGPAMFALVLLGFGVSQAVRVGCDLWLAAWTERSLAGWTHGEYALGYGAWVLGFCLFVVIRSVLFLFALLRAGTSLHNAMFRCVLAAPMRFFWRNPSGRILNRFSKDMDHLDKLLLHSATDFLNFAAVAVGAVVAVVAIFPWLLLLLLPLAVSFALVTRYFLRSSRELKRLEGVSRSPVYQRFAALLQGLVSVRAYGEQSRLEREFTYTCDRNHSVALAFHACSRWLGMRLDVCSVLLVFGAALLSVLLKRSVSAGVVGVALAQALQLTGIFQYAVRQAAETETLMTSVERVSEYGALPTECGVVPDAPDAPAPPRASDAGEGDSGTAAAAAASASAIISPADVDAATGAAAAAAAPVMPASLPPGWPARGSIAVRGAQLRYQPDLPRALRGVDLHVGAREKVGIVGKSGHGKSSLGMALFRIVELEAGSVAIDDVRTNTVDVRRLRGTLSIIPQDALLFRGSLRFNLDPFNQHSDTQIWDALRRAHLADTVAAMPGGLATQVVEGGDNFSQGERQLLAMARALLRPAAILYMDEATSNVDPETDKLIQATIRSEFADRTVLTVAHRLDTVIDADKIAVMQRGRVAECGPPHELLRDPESLFARLVAETGPDNARKLRALAEEHARKKQAAMAAAATAPAAEAASATVTVPAAEAAEK